MSPQPILIRDESGGWREPAVTSYGNERELQDLVVGSPDLLTGEKLATTDEFPVPDIGYVDIVGISADGAITIVECKLRANPEIRRQMIGQLTAYAGGLWQMTYDDFAAAWETRSTRPLVEHVREATDSTADDETLRRAVSNSLHAGSFTMVVAVDEITDELKRSIEYLNAVTKDDVRVLGLELQYVKDSSAELLIPRTYGEGMKKPAASTSSRKWSEHAFMEAVETLPEHQRSVVEKLVRHGREFAANPWWGSGQVPSMSWYYRISSGKIALFQIVLKPGAPAVVPSIGGLAIASSAGPSKALELLNLLRSLDGVAPYLSGISESQLNRYPSIPIVGVLDLPGNAERFLAAIDKICGRT